MDKYKFRSYNKNSPSLYRREKNKLNVTLPKSIYIEHIGSSAVPGLGGKGLIDILMGASKSKIKKIKIILKKAGYEFRPNTGNKNRLFFRRDYTSKGKTRRVHIHIVPYKSKEWLEPIAVRDYLRNNKEEIRKYEEVKRKAVKLAKGDGEKYREAKDKYLKTLTKKALK